MFNLDPGKLLLVAIVAVMVLGPDKLPDAARRLGAAWRSFSEFRHQMESEVRQTIPDLPSSGELARLVRSPASFLNHLGDIGTDTIDLPEADVAGSVGASNPVDAPPASTSLAPRHAAAAAETPPPDFAALPGDANLN